jgi:hypothetical protein
MSKTNDWGDKVIITLHSDGERRYKKWCDKYCDGECRYYLGKCTGSVHCTQYKNKYDDHSGSFYQKKEDVQIPDQPASLPKTGYVFEQYFRRARLYEKLLGKTVLVRSAAYILRFGVVTEESFEIISVFYEGQVHKYDRRTAYRSGSIYVYEETKEKETL